MKAKMIALGVVLVAVTLVTARWYMNNELRGRIDVAQARYLDAIKLDDKAATCASLDTLVDLYRQAKDVENELTYGTLKANCRQ